MWVIFRRNACKTLKRQYTLLFVNTDITFHKFVTLHYYIHKKQCKVKVKVTLVQALRLCTEPYGL